MTLDNQILAMCSVRISPIYPLPNPIQRLSLLRSSPAGNLIRQSHQIYSSPPPPHITATYYHCQQVASLTIVFGNLIKFILHHITTLSPASCHRYSSITATTLSAGLIKSLCTSTRHCSYILISIIFSPSAAWNARVSQM